MPEPWPWLPPALARGKLTDVEEAEVMDKEKLATILAELRAELECIYGDRLHRLILYGSQARGDAEPDSDVDVLVVLDGEVAVGREIRRTEAMSSDVSLHHEVTVYCCFISRRDYEHEDSGFLANVRREGIAA